MIDRTVWMRCPYDPDLETPMARSEKGKRMTAPNSPTDEEVALTKGFRWEYEQQTFDVSSFGEPEGSRRPHITIRRRIVGPWEVYDTDG